MSNDKKKIVLGSGKLYLKENTEAISEIPELIKSMAVPENLIGNIQGGATLEYKPTFYQAKSDDGVESKTIITEEEATLKSGIMTWNGKTLQKLCATATVTDDTEKSMRVVEIGGTNNNDGKNYVILFVQEDPKDGNCYVLMVGSNQAGFSLAFVKDKETVIDAEFKAKAMNERGTMIVYAEDIPKGVQ